ncbi:MAG: molybdate-binding protein, partial [Actinomycetota bacterium]
MRLRSVASVAVALLLGACSSAPDAGAHDRLTIFGAASLTEAFTDIGASFESENDVEVSLSFAGMPDLVAQ